MADELRAFIGVNLEDYVRQNYQAVSLADAVKALLPEAQVSVVAGTGIVPSEPTDFASAIAAARDAEIVLLAIGGHSAWFGDDVTEGEGRDTADIDLPPQQVALVHAVADVGTPVVGVLSMGRPYALSAVVDRLPAIITAYYGGPYQGQALADALFGVTNPGGKLPFTLPRHVGQVPIHHAQRVGSGYRRTLADIHRGYLDVPSTPLYTFGHGLSYTTFDYSPLVLEGETVDVNGTIRASLTITNVGPREGTEVVQLYAADTATGITLPAQQLVGFARVALAPGESKSVTFEVPVALLGYTGRTGEFVIEPGPVVLSAGSSSSDLRSIAQLTLVGETRVIGDDERVFLSHVRIDDVAPQRVAPSVGVEAIPHEV